MWKLVMSVGLIFVSIMIVFSMGCAAAPNPIPISEVQLHSLNHTVASSPFSVTFLEITGEVWVAKINCIERQTAYLTAEQSEGWEVVIEPSVIPFIIASSEEFTALVIVPPGIDPGSRELTIHSTIMMPGMAPSRSNATCNIQVEGYHHISIEGVEPVISISNEEAVGLAVFIVNLGTLDETCAFELMLKDDVVVPQGVPSIINISAGERRLVRMLLDLGGLVDGRSEELEVSIISFEEVTNWSSVDRKRLDSDSIKIMVWDLRESLGGLKIGSIGLSLIVLAVIFSMAAVAVMYAISKDMEPPL